MCLVGTYKFIKKDLQKEAFDVEQISDEVYILDTKEKRYKRLDSEIYSNILNGNLRF